MKIFLILCMIFTLISCPNEDPASESSSDNTDSQQNTPSTTIPTSQSTNSTKITSLQALIDTKAADSEINLSEYTIEGSMSAEINKKITINGGGLDFNNSSITVLTDGIELNGISNASVTAASSLGNGSLKIASSSLSSLTILGGGINSIYILDVSVDTITVAKQSDSYRDDIVRLVYDASTDLGNIIANSDMLLYYDGENDTQLDASNIAVAENVNVATNTEITNSSDNAVASITLSDSQTPDLHILLKNGGKLNEALINQTVAYMSPEDAKLVSINQSIDFTESISRNKDYSIANRTDEFEFIFDFGGTADNTYILKNKTTGETTIPTNIGNGMLSPRYTTQISDKDGNIYLTYTSPGSRKTLIVGFTYSELCKMEQTGNCNMSVYTLIEVPAEADIQILDRQFIRFAMYEKGETKHLFILQNQLWDVSDDCYYKPNIICLDVTTDSSNSSMGFKAIGMTELNIDYQYMFGQAITVDENENLYIGINKFEVKQNEESQVYIDFSSSLVNMYYFTPLKEDETNQFDYTEFVLELQNSAPYSNYTESTIYNITEPIENPTLYRILQNYTFGLESIDIQ